MTDTSKKAAFLIVKQGCYYRPNSQGYTPSAVAAGRYTKEDAEDITHPNGADGPRDGMFYIHEDEALGDDWKAYKALRSELDEAKAENERLRRKGDVISDLLRLSLILQDETDSRFAEAGDLAERISEILKGQANEHPTAR